MAQGKKTIDLAQWKSKELKLSVIKSRRMSSNDGFGYWQEALTGNKGIKETNNIFESVVMPKLPPAWIKRSCDCLNNKTILEPSTFYRQAEKTVQ